MLPVVQVLRTSLPGSLLVLLLLWSSMFSVHYRSRSQGQEDSIIWILFIQQQISLVLIFLEESRLGGFCCCFSCSIRICSAISVLQLYCQFWLHFNIASVSVCDYQLLSIAEFCRVVYLDFVVSRTIIQYTQYSITTRENEKQGSPARPSQGCNPRLSSCWEEFSYQCICQWDVCRNVSSLVLQFAMNNYRQYDPYSQSFKPRSLSLFLSLIQYKLHTHTHTHSCHRSCTQIRSDHWKFASQNHSFSQGPFCYWHCGYGGNGRVFSSITQRFVGSARLCVGLFNCVTPILWTDHWSQWNPIEHIGRCPRCTTSFGG